MRGSIRLRLSLFYGGLLTLVLLAFSSGVHLVFRRQLYHALDSELEADAQGAEKLLRREVLEADEQAEEDETEEAGTEHGRRDAPLGPGGFEGIDVAATDIFLHLFGPEGQTLQRSANLGKRALVTDVRFLKATSQPVTTEHPTLGRLRQCVRAVVLPGGTYWVVVAEPLASVERALDALLRLFVLFVPGAVLLVAGGGYLLAGRALRPVDAVIRAARAIRAGDLSRRIALRGPPDELKRLADELDEMLAALEGLVLTQRRFVADASHELRTPLTVIDSCLQVHLRAPEPTTEQLRESLVVIRGETQRMKRLVTDLLTLARADAGEEQLRVESVDLTALLHEVRRKAEWLTPQHTLRAEVEPGLQVRGDPRRLEQLMLNLVDNAAKHTPPEGSISLWAHRRGDEVTCGVTDTGCGIAAEHLPHLFERFYRVDRARSREEGGSGLGLAICRMIAEAHGGRIEVDSTPGRGTTFAVALPGDSQTPTRGRSKKKERP